jgi:hypothetical protein
VDTIGKLGFQVFGCTSRAHTQYKWRLAKDWEAKIKRAITVVTMFVIE